MQDEGERGPAPRPASAAIAAALCAFGGYYALVVLVGLLLGPVERGTPAEVEHGMLALLAASAVWLPLAARFPPRVPLFGRAVVARSAVLYVMFLAAWVPITWMLYPALMNELGRPLQAQPQLAYFTAPPASAWGPWVSVLAACVVVPLTEEVLFRGYLQDALRGVLPRGLAVLATAVLFGLAHGLMFAVPIGMLGLLFAALRERFTCLEAPVFVHALHNTATIVVTWIFPSVLHPFQS